MKVENSLILKAALGYGADDAVIVSADNETKQSIIVLFSRYFVTPPAQKGYIALSPYYVASNRGYMAARKLTEHLKSLGAAAKHDTDMSAKAAALKAGGYIGKNGFYFHSKFGSLVNIQTIVTDSAVPKAYPPGSSKCENCDTCIKVCPSGGVNDLQKCLRYHSNSLIPKKLRGDLYQLLGCERCQTACPQNSDEQRPTQQFRTDELLAGKHKAELKTLAGSNMARANRLLSQAALYAANTGQVSQIEQLRKLAETALSPTKEHALWAIEQLEGEPP